jgi:hypothetical protein
LAVLAGQPNTARYRQVTTRAYTALKGVGLGATPEKHRRGLYTAIAVGISYGQGQEEPGYLSTNYPAHAEKLLNDPDIQEMSLFASSE